MTPAKFRAARAKLGMTQAALAEALGKSLSHISHVEQGAENASASMWAHVTLMLKVAQG